LLRTRIAWCCIDAFGEIGSPREQRARRALSPEKGQREHTSLPLGRRRELVGWARRFTNYPSALSFLTSSEIIAEPARQADGAAAGLTRAPGSATILPSPESEVVSVETTKVISVKSAKSEIVAIEASHRNAKW
jgi:hypothetical protein